MNNSRIHLALFIFWLLFFIPCLIFWRTSILLVIFISFYAIWVEHLVGYEAAKGKELNKEKHD